MVPDDREVQSDPCSVRRRSGLCGPRWCGYTTAMFGGRESVHVGRDGWLFLVGGSNRVMDRYRGGLRHWLLLRAWAKLIRVRAARARALGIRCLHVVVPEKLSVYDNLTGRSVPRRRPISARGPAWFRRR